MKKRVELEASQMKDCTFQPNKEKNRSFFFKLDNSFTKKSLIEKSFQLYSEGLSKIREGKQDVQSPTELEYLRNKADCTFHPTIHGVLKVN